MSNVNQAAASSGDDVVWFVQISPSQMRAMTLDELDDAFQHGRIDEHTLVREDGKTDWAALGNVAGLEAADAAPLSESLRPVVSNVSDLDFDLTLPRRSRRGLVLSAMALAAVVGAIAFGATKLSRSPAAHASAPTAVAAPTPVAPAATMAIPPPPPIVAKVPASVAVAAPVLPAVVHAPAKKAVAPKKSKKSKSAR